MVAQQVWQCAIASETDVLVDGAPVQPLHADLHGGNLKWHEGQLAVFDFDDCGLGVPALDLAVAVFYLRGDDPQLEGALTAGYAEVRPLPDVDPGHFEAMIAARQPSPDRAPPSGPFRSELSAVQS